MRCAAYNRFVSPCWHYSLCTCTSSIDIYSEHRRISIRYLFLFTEWPVVLCYKRRSIIRLVMDSGTANDLLMSASSDSLSLAPKIEDSSFYSGKQVSRDKQTHSPSYSSKQLFSNYNSVEMLTIESVRELVSRLADISRLAKLSGMLTGREAGAIYFRYIKKNQQQWLLQLNNFHVYMHPLLVTAHHLRRCHFRFLR